ncbi:hypothetical protein F0562_035781 [Nyssa sinensis]|uniref:Homeobox domain-containing protein n=1 Tax=Nyssa sinensis TaxID=561372 RepID=A0A5J5AFD3_9ASTE|nr:hypothetical protein F0562_035781 [Nyssa sinensis]
MEDYNQLSENTTPRGSFLYGSPLLAPSSSVYGRSSNGSNVSNQQTQMAMNTLHLQSSECYQSESQAHPILKTEAGSSQHVQKFHYPSIIRGHQAVLNQQEEQGNESSSEVEAIKSKIISHPQYPNLLDAFMDCQKVGAPPEVVARLKAVRHEFETRQRASVTCRDGSKDPELDQFMEAYYDMLVKYREELTKPLQEATEFMRRIESQLNMLSNGPIRIFSSDEKGEGVGSSDEDQDNSGGETDLPEIDPRAEDRELKNHLLRKYSGYLSSLKQELSKKKKKGKLPKDARQKLLNWWELHYKWPYPSETEKVALAESTGLDQKQINNWFINQRKRHWKPSEDMQFMVMDGLHPQNAALYMEGHYMGDGPY